MSTNSLPVFDKTMHTTNVWLGEIMRDLGPDRNLAWKVLSVVLHKLRDRLPIALAAHFGAQLPLLIRGAYYDQFEPDKLPGDCHSSDVFVKEVQEKLHDTRGVDARDAIASVFGVLSRHLSHGQIEKVRHALPTSIRNLWPETLLAESAQAVID